VIGKRVVMVVGEFPTIVWKHQGHHTNCTHDLIDKAISSERSMSAFVANNKEPCGCRTTEDPSEWKEIPRG